MLSQELRSLRNDVQEMKKESLVQSQRLEKKFLSEVQELKREFRQAIYRTRNEMEEHGEDIKATTTQLKEETVGEIRGELQQSRTEIKTETNRIKKDVKTILKLISERAEESKKNVSLEIQRLEKTLVNSRGDTLSDIQDIHSEIQAGREISQQTKTFLLDQVASMRQAVIAQVYDAKNETHEKIEVLKKKLGNDSQKKSNKTSIQMRAM
jgi:hypothetical protein